MEEAFMNSGHCFGWEKKIFVLVFTICDLEGHVDKVSRLITWEEIRERGRERVSTPVLTNNVLS